MPTALSKLTNLQADSLVSATALRWIGGMRTYAARVNFLLAVPNTLMIAFLAYGDSPTLQAVFGSRVLWLGFILFVVAPTAVLLDRVLLHPAQIAYTAHQNSRQNRNPAYRLIEENNRRLDRIEAKLDGRPARLSVQREDDQ